MNNLRTWIDIYYMQSYHHKAKPNFTFRIFGFLGLILTGIFLATCVDPIQPAFDYQDKILFIDAYALTETGSSSVSIKESLVNRTGSYSVINKDNAIVQFVNLTNGLRVDCQQGPNGNYFPPNNFRVAEGETWKLEIELDDGRRYESEEETIQTLIPIDGINARFEKELSFDDGLGEFIPGHAITIDWADPAEETNHYLWRYRSYEPLTICRTCDRSRLRGGECTGEVRFPRYFNYLCEVDCWQIRYSERFKIMDDRLVNGRDLTDQLVAAIPFYRKVRILVEIQQLSLTKSGYEYFQIVEDIANESGGLNAPPPSALIGNIRSLDNENETVLGQFTASSVSVKRIFLERDNLDIDPITPDLPIRLEDCGGLPCPDSLILYPCIIDDFRTSIKPKGWE